MRTTIQGLVNEANQVNQNYADAFKNVGNTVTSTPGSGSSPFGQIDTGNATAQAQIVQKFEDAVNSDLTNGNNWAKAIETQKQYNDAKRASFVNEFSDNI